jgi:predicted esterase
MSLLHKHVRICTHNSSWLPFAKEYPDKLGAGVKAGTPILQCHGDSDEVVQYSWGKQSHDAMKAMGLPAEFETYRCVFILSVLSMFKC